MAAEKRENSALSDDQYINAKRLKLEENELKAPSTGKFVKEVDVGVTQYISQHQGFFGILKQRWVRKHCFVFN